MALTALHPAPTVVVIDDSKLGRFFAKNALSRAGFAVVAEGTTGREAVELYEKHRPSLLLLDIVLPELDGVSAARTILARAPNARLVICTAFPSRDQVLAARDLGVAHFLLKPMTADKLASVAAEVAEGTTWR